MSYNDLVHQYNAELRPGNPPEWHEVWRRRFAPYHELLDLEPEETPVGAIETTCSS